MAPVIVRAALRAAASCCVLAGLAQPTDVPLDRRRDMSGPDTPGTIGVSAGALASKGTGAEALAVRVPPRSIDALIEDFASRYRVRVSLVRAVIEAESAFNPRALSSKGAMGLMQLMPSTAQYLGVVDAFDPSENLRGGVAYLRHLLDRYHGDERLALAAYNAGPGAVDRFGQTVPPFPETLDHGARTIGRAESVDMTDEEGEGNGADEP